MMADLLGAGGFTALELVILATFTVTFCWISVAFWTAIPGLVLTALRRDPLSLGRAPGPPPGDKPIRSRIALVMPIYHESPSRVRTGLAAVLDSLARTGHANRFDTYLLSDSTDPRIAREEEMAWSALRREFGGSTLLYYRRRSSNVGRKAGNIADFCQRWGSYYDFMVVLDADSIMEGSTLLELVRIMEDNPEAGLVQTLPAPVLQDTLFGRMVQFSRWLYGPMVAAGLSFWQTDAGNYWGHNAIVRMKPFMEHCGLPRLPGPPPLGGDILSHDVVEGALLRRAGWKVFLLPWLGGSYEEVPGNLLDYARRDRRWTQGNLQHLRLMPAPGFPPVSRIQFLLGAMSYLSSPIWLLMLLACTLYAAAPGAGFTMPLAGESPGQGILPTYEAGFIVPLLFIVIAVLFLPKVLALLLVAAREPKRFGGPRRLLASGTLEMLAAVILAPVMMMYHSHFVISILRGRDSGWEPQTRDSQAIPWGEAWRRTAVITAIGLAWTGIALLSSAWLFLWLTPILIGLLFAAPLARWTSRRAVGEWTRRRGLFLVPSETAPPRVVTESSRARSKPSPRSAEAPWGLPPERPRTMDVQRLVRRGSPRWSSVPNRS